MERMQSSGLQMAAAGVVGVRITEGPLSFARHVMGFTAWGTAVALGGDGHVGIQPDVVLPLDDVVVQFAAEALRDRSNGPAGGPVRTRPAGRYPGAAVARRDDLRNVAIVAHVDHGKTTLVDAMLRQTGAFRANQEVTDRVMDSGDLEREKGITILAKNTAVQYGGDHRSTSSTPPATPTSAARSSAGLTMVDGVLLLVDAAEGPLPQTRFVLRKTLEARLPVVWWSTRSTAPTPASPRSSTRSRSSSWTSTPTRTRSTSRSSTPTPGRAGRHRPRGAGTDLAPLFEAIVRPRARPDLRPRPPAPGPRDQPRRLPLRRPPGHLPGPERHARRGDSVAWCRLDGSVERAKVTELYTPEALERVDAEEAGPGEIVAVAGLAEVTIGETLADPERPRAAPGHRWSTSRASR